MMKASFILPLAFMVSACAATPPPVQTAKLITAAEAKSEACPASLLEAGASSADCGCVESALFTLGQTPGALTPTSNINRSLTPSAEAEADYDGRRKIAIGLLRLEAIEQCGLFDTDHIVSKNLQRPKP